MKLNYITFMVRDIEKTIRFYTEYAGLKVVRRFNPGMGEIAFMADKEGDTELEFIQFDNAQKVQTIGMTMSFKVEDRLEELHDRLSADGYEVSDIINQPPKPVHFTVKDPDGTDVEFGL